MVSRSIQTAMQNGSFIRKMFEEGDRLRALYGADQVFDFSLGNPDGEPPEECLRVMETLVRQKGVHRYMVNAGLADARARVAAYEATRSGLPLEARHIVMSVGAAGAINCAFRAILEPGDEVLVVSPYFAEYLSYIGNYGGVPVRVPARQDDFQLDIPAIAKAVTPRTRAMILNSPNNPTGVVYPADSLRELDLALRQREHELQMDSPILVLSDEPYAKLAYGVEVPPVLKLVRHSVVINSFSKSLSLPGERIGYLAVRPDTKDADLLVAALAYTTRILGYVNAPSLFQEAASLCLDVPAPVESYRRRGELLYEILTENGYDCPRPDGAFYLFPRSFLEDDVEFSRIAAQYRILLVPGSGFGCPGRVRLAYCVNEDMIRRSRDAFRALSQVFGH